MNFRPIEGETRKVVMSFKVLPWNTFDHWGAGVIDGSARIWEIIGPVRSMLSGAQLALNDAPIFRVEIDGNDRRAVRNVIRRSHRGDYRQLGRRRVSLELHLPARFQQQV